MAEPISHPHDAELVAHLGWVRALARALVRDPAGADDLAQDVARVWLERRPVLSGGPRAWLAAVARRLSADRARSEAARARRERTVARDEAGEGPHEIVERSARLRRVAEAVGELEEPARSTILYRYLDGLSSREAADRMGVSEEVVRKRLERGLARLRQRFDRESGSREAWALALLGPSGPGKALGILGKGAGWMGAKSVAVAAVVVAGAVWFFLGREAGGPEVAVGGSLVVVPPEDVAARRATETATPPAGGELVESARAAVTPRAAETPVLEGFVLVDGERRVPPGLEIRAERVPASDPTIDVARASWRLDPAPGAPFSLWVTSPSTVPALLPVPEDLAREGGVIDLQLTEGSVLALTFLDLDTREPLAGVDFQLSSAIELERSRGRVSTRANLVSARTDADGRAELSGIALPGIVSVRLDLEERARELLMRDGQTIHVRTSGRTVWHEWLKPGAGARLERTVLARRPLGTATASGTVPLWAGPLEQVRVVARELGDGDQNPGDPFALPVGDDGFFELSAQAPCRHEVWLEGREKRTRLSAETRIEFRAPGPAGTIVLRPPGPAAPAATLHFRHVPARGHLELGVLGDPSRNADLACAGVDFSHELPLGTDESLRIRLTLEDRHAKSGWTRTVDGRERDRVIDLTGAAHRVRIEAEGLAKEGGVGLLRCVGDQVNPEEVVVVLHENGRGIEPVFLPDGRWLYCLQAEPDAAGLWGTIDVRAGMEELVLRPRARLATGAEIGAGLRIEAVDGIRLTALPEAMRVVRSGGEAVPVPLDAELVPLGD